MDKGEQGRERSAPSFSQRDMFLLNPFKKRVIRLYPYAYKVNRGLGFSSKVVHRGQGSAADGSTHS